MSCNLDDSLADLMFIILKSSLGGGTTCAYGTVGAVLEDPVAGSELDEIAQHIVCCRRVHLEDGLMTTLVQVVTMNCVRSL